VAAEQVRQAVDALRAGKPVLLSTDTVYGLCASPYRPEPVRRLYELKGRDESQPIALLAGSVEMLFECVPELHGRAGVIARLLLPGPYTLVLPNPSRRYRWLTGNRPDAIGVRVPELPPAALRVVDAIGAVAATSANASGAPPAASLDEVPEAIREVCVAVEGGRLPGTASTVIDFTGPEPVVIREGAAPAGAAIARIRAALGS
jgi:L-threonylcarbamoyladenylate synthase